MRLLEGYERNDHHVYMDNYYTSPALFLEMAQNGFGACGTARVNRQGMPEEWKISRKGKSVKMNKEVR